MRNQKPILNQAFHIPVLLSEVIEYIQVAAGKWYVDATAGGGGHTEAIIKLGGRVLAIEQDDQAVEFLSEKFAIEIENRTLVIQKGNFRDITQIARRAKKTEIAGVLFDLGMSNFQIKRSSRGFSFQTDEPLDMRMNQKNTVTAASIINTYTSEELAQLFTHFGEENAASEISEALVQARAREPIETTRQLAEVITEVYKQQHRWERIHPATRVFQALRIAVNDELESLRLTLPQAIELLEPSGRCLVISFHSLEDRIVKQTFLNLVNQDRRVIITKKPIIATIAEKRENPASRSAKLRVFQKN